MQYGFYFDQSRCIGCYGCVAACRSWNRLDENSPDLIEIVKREGGEYPHPTLQHLFLTCFHCVEPSCIPACPSGLLVKRAEDGVVVISDPRECTSCHLCVEACPYHAIKIGSTAESPISKCNLCIDRVSEGRVPACVAACPTEALDFGPMEKLTGKYGQLKKLEGLPAHGQTDPSVVFRASTGKSQSQR